MAEVFAYVANNGSHNVSVIRTSDNTVTATVAVGRRPFAIAITPDGAFAYVTNGSSNNVSVIRTSDNTVTATVAVGTFPHDIAITPDGAFAYVANLASGAVSVIRTSDNTVTATVAVGINPLGVAVTPDGAFAYVANVDSHTVSVIRTSDNTVTATVALGVGTGPVDVAFTIISGGGPIPVDLDIKPGSSPNSINLGARGVIPVAILTTPSFDAAEVDPETVTLGDDDGDGTPVKTKKNGSLFASLQDVDGDSDLDLVLKFDQPALEADSDLNASTTELILNGETFGGQPIKGSDSVRITPASFKEEEVGRPISGATPRHGNSPITGG